MRPQYFAEYRARAMIEVRRLLSDVEATEELARKESRKPGKYRKATGMDLAPGEIFWHTEGDGVWHWQIVETPFDDWTGYTSVNGDSYHLRNAYVEVLW